MDDDVLYDASVFTVARLRADKAVARRKLAALEARIERMRCCGNCSNYAHMYNECQATGRKEGGSNLCPQWDAQTYTTEERMTYTPEDCDYAKK